MCNIKQKLVIIIRWPSKFLPHSIYDLYNFLSLNVDEAVWMLALYFTSMIMVIYMAKGNLQKQLRFQIRSFLINQNKDYLGVSDLIWQKPLKSTSKFLLLTSKTEITMSSKAARNWILPPTWINLEEHHEPQMEMQSWLIHRL